MPTEIIKFDSGSDVLVQKYGGTTISLGAQVIVNQSQEAVFCKGGVIVGILGPGSHALTTGNIDFLPKLRMNPSNARSPFTAEIWFVDKTVRRNRDWGTPSRILVRDIQTKLPLHVGAYGKWGFRIENTNSFMAQIIGTHSSADSEYVEEFFIGEIHQHLAEKLATVLKTDSYMDVTAKLSSISEQVFEKLADVLKRYGIEPVNFSISSINIPDGENDQLFKMMATGKEEKFRMDNLGLEGVKDYTAIRSLDALGSAAQNEGSGGSLMSAGLGAGLGLGFGLPVGQQVGAQAAAPQQAPHTANEKSAADRLRDLKTMLEENIISQEEYDSKRNEIISKL